MRKTPIVQFGTSRFLQAHADFFISEAMDTGAALGPVTVVQSSGDPARAARLAALAAPQGYPVKIRGLRDGIAVDEERHVRSIARTLSTVSDLEDLKKVIAEEAEIILSNTADAGFRPSSADNCEAFDQAMSYPAKLAHLLLYRFRETGAPIQVMPTELIQNNGDALRSLVLNVAEHLPADFRDWLRSEVRFVNSLVDRIVSEPLEPAGAVAEPYALWAIEDAQGLILPCRHPDVQVVPDLQRIEQMKLFILNLGHTYLVARWEERGREGASFVRDLMNDPVARPDLEDLYEAEVLPGFRAAAQGDEARDYVSTTLERFANPFLDHRLADIAQNHGEKVQRRIKAFVDWSREQGDTAAKPRLEAVIDGA